MLCYEVLFIFPTESNLGNDYSENMNHPTSSHSHDRWIKVNMHLPIQHKCNFFNSLRFLSLPPEDSDIAIYVSN